MSYFTWEQVLARQHNDYEAFCVPYVSERKAESFELRTISLTDIPSKNYTTLSEYEESDCFDDVEIVSNLMRAYVNDAPVPPIILDKDYKVIDGYHRLSALNQIGIKCFPAFVAVY